MWAFKTLQNLHFFIGARVAQFNTQQKTVNLGFGQWECAFKLDWVLGGQHQKGARQGHRHPIDRALALLHGLEQGRLGARRSAVNLVGQQHIGKNRAGPKFKLLLFLVKIRHPGHIAGQQVGGELDAAKGAIEATGDGLGQRGFACARHIFNQHMAFA